MGAWTGVLALCMARDSSSESPRFKCEISVLFQAFLLHWQRGVAPLGDMPKRCRRGFAVGRSIGGKRGFEPASRGLRLELFPYPNRRFWIREEDRSEGERGRSRGDEVERVTARFDAAHADDRKSGLAIGGEDRREGHRPEDRTGEPADPGTELRLERLVVEREPAI